MKEVKEVGEKRIHFRNPPTRPQCRAECWLAGNNLRKNRNKNVFPVSELLGHLGPDPSLDWSSLVGGWVDTAGIPGSHLG